MKRLAWIVVVAAFSVAALFALIAALLPGDVLKTRIGEQISAWTGRDVSLRGEPRIGVFPTLSVTLDDVRIDGPPAMEDAQIISMDRLKGTIRFLPLIIGRVEIDSFTMVRPLIHLVRDQRGRRNWQFDSGAAALQLAFAGDVPLGEFHIEGGTVLFEDRGSGENERLDSLDLTVEWTSVRQPIHIDGSAIWRGEQVAVSGGAREPFGYLNGGATPIEARIASAPMSLSLNGEARGYPRMRVGGALELSTPSLRRFMSWLGSPVGPGSTLGDTSLAGTATFADGVLSVADARFTLDGNSANGALKIALGPTPDFTGTLAFGALDLTPYFGGLSAALALAPDWRKVALPTDWLNRVSADVRLSANSMMIGDLAASETAASVSLRDGRLEIGLAQANVGSGSLSGDLEVLNAPAATGADFAAHLRATDIDLAGMRAFLHLPHGTAGTATAMVDASAQGGDLGALVGALRGSSEIDVTDGKVPLFGIDGIAAARTDTTSPAGGDPLAPVPVQSAAVKLSFADGVASVEQANVVTAGYAADVSGRIDLLGGRTDLNGILRSGAPGADQSAGAPFTIEGVLARPIVRRQALAN